MSKTVKIPEDRNPFVVEVNNGRKYSYPAGTTQTVPDEVAAVIAAYEASGKPANPPFVRKGMPDAGADGDVLVAVDGKWAAQDGYGYTDGGEVSKIDEKYLPESGGGVTVLSVVCHITAEDEWYSLHLPDGRVPTKAELLAVLASGPAVVYTKNDASAPYLPTGYWSLALNSREDTLTASIPYGVGVDPSGGLYVGNLRWSLYLDDDDASSGKLSFRTLY